MDLKPMVANLQKREFISHSSLRIYTKYESALAFFSIYYVKKGRYTTNNLNL
ncbi:unnamed protein product [Brassica napus]|uniref:(rape) hypothetical protein n=1 Tax=Brassica napus TaxID=3708 RepID=A0A816Q739_BRANA|nr:unnamed protein product [Brassica napus]